MGVSILITTRNRLEELKRTLDSLYILIEKGITIMVCDDYSQDESYNYIQKNYPDVLVFKNTENKGYIYSRNFLMSVVKTKYAITLDDDANFLSEDAVDVCIKYFEDNPTCAVTAFRIFWSKNKPEHTLTNDKSKIVKSYVGCGHGWRMKAWKEIPDYPEWFKFYGEENFASFHLFKKKWEIHYVPEILVQHRVNNKARKSNKDFYERRENALKADWFNFLLFYPVGKIPYRIGYSIFMQFKKGWIRKDISRFRLIVSALFNILKKLVTISKNRKALTKNEFNNWQKLPDAEIYWSPDF